MTSCVQELFNVIYRSRLLSIALITIAILTTWTMLSYHSSEIQSTSPAALPDAYMEIVTALIMDKQGKPSIKIVTPKMVHYLEDDRSEFSEPQLTIYRKSPQPWFITSKFAKALKGMEHVLFWDDVTIHHAADLASPATVIKTPTLTVHPNAQTAETNDPITFVQPNLVVKAIGMFADINTGSIKLLSKARGEYAPS